MPATTIGATGAKATTAGALVGLLLLAGCTNVNGSLSTIPSTPSPAAATSLPAAGTTASPEAAIPHIAAASGNPGSIPSSSTTVLLEGETNGITVCDGSVWVAVGAPRDAEVRIDPDSGGVVGEIEGGSNLACLDDEPWVAVGGAEIRHLDPDTMETIASVPVSTYYVGTGAGSVWAPSGGDVVRIDPETAKVVATIPIHSYFDVTEVEGNEQAVWATVKQADMVYRIDPTTNAVVADVAAGAFAHGILVQSGAVWISNGHEESLTRIDPATNGSLFVDGTGSGVGLAEGNGSVWASSRDGDIFRVDPTTSQAVPLVHVDGWPYGIAATSSALWFSDGIVSAYGVPFSELDE